MPLEFEFICYYLEYIVNVDTMGLAPNDLTTATPTYSLGLSLPYPDLQPRQPRGSFHRSHHASCLIWRMLGVKHDL